MKQAELNRYVALQELPHDWSIKTCVDISVSLKHDKENLSLSTDPIQHNLQYFVFSSDQKVPELYNNDKETLKLQMKIQWMRSMRDVFRKFLHSKPLNDLYVEKSVPLPFFYVRNYNFCALFMRDSEQKPICVLDPSKNLTAVINEQSI